MVILESKSRIRKNRIKDKKLIVIILLELMCVILCLNLYTQVSAKALITKYKNTGNIKNELTVVSNVTILDNKEDLNFSVVTNVDNSNFLNIKKPELSLTKDGYILKGKIAISDILSFSNSSELKEVTYKFDKDKNLISGKVNLGNSLDQEIINIISSNVLESNENLSVEDIKNSIKCNSNSIIKLSVADSEIVNEVFSTKLIEQLKTLNTSNIIDKDLLKVKIGDETYTLRSSTIEADVKDDDTAYKKDNIVYYLDNKVIYGVTGPIKDINFNGCKSLKDLEKSLGKPTNVINDMSYWELKDEDKTLYITYSNDRIEIMYK